MCGLKYSSTSCLRIFGSVTREAHGIGFSWGKAKRQKVKSRGDFGTDTIRFKRRLLRANAAGCLSHAAVGWVSFWSLAETFHSTWRSHRGRLLLSSYFILYFCSLCVCVCMCILDFRCPGRWIVNSRSLVNLWIHYWDEFSERLLCTKCFTKCDGEENINERLYLARQIPTGKTCMCIKFIAEYSQGLWIHIALEVLLVGGWTQLN